MKNKKLMIALALMLFLMFFIFFSQVHPIIVYDGDDWEGIGIARFPLPNWNAWNPIKVLPEGLVEAVGYISAYIVYPIVGDYIQSITYVTASILAFLIAAFFLLLTSYTSKVSCLEIKNLWLNTIIFTLLSFLMFKNNENSIFLFFSGNLICYYHYVIPALVNMCLVLYMMLYNDFLDSFSKFSNIKKGLIISWIYLAVFSNVLHNIILITYVSLMIIFNFIRHDGGLKDKIITSIKDCTLYYSVILTWIVALIMEVHGGRSRQIGATVSFMNLPFDVTVKNLLHNLMQINKWTLAFYFLIIIVAAVYMYKYRYEYKGYLKSIFYELKIKFLCMLSVIAYIVVVCAKAAPSYAGRVDVQISFLFYWLIIMSVLLGVIIKLQPKILMIIPFYILTLFLATVRTNSHYRESTMGNINPKLCKIVDDNIIAQTVDADRRGLKEMTLLVPKGDDNDNWPHPNYMGRNISRTLYSHGIISRPMKITIQADEKMTKIVRP